MLSPYMNGLVLLSSSSEGHEQRAGPGADTLSVYNVCQTCFWGVLFACKYDDQSLIVCLSYCYVQSAQTPSDDIIKHLTFFSSRLKSMQMSLFQGELIIWVSVISGYFLHVSPASLILNKQKPWILYPTSGHQPHRAAHPRHSERGSLQMATWVHERPRAQLETGHFWAGRPAERSY